MILESDLDFWIKNNLNVLFIGKHGVGKTSLVEAAFNKHGLKWKYFSAATMDPWVDFIGIPKEKKDGDREYLDILPPKDFSDDSIEALFFDEFNRSPKKVRNAVMELIQFKSINGRKFKNLKFIWAAINPKNEKDEYDVEELDPAQVDRFHVHIEVEYKPVKEYFDATYGKELSNSALEWWHSLNVETKNLISPRRLDYCLDIFKRGGNLRHVLPKGINVKDLIKTLKDGPIKDKIQNLITSKSKANIEAFLSDINNRDVITKDIKEAKLFKKSDLINTFSEFLPDEDISNLMVVPEFREYIAKNVLKVKKFRDIANAIIASKGNQGLSLKVAKLLKDHGASENGLDLNFKTASTPDRLDTYKKLENLYDTDNIGASKTISIESFGKAFSEVIKRSHSHMIRNHMRKACEINKYLTKNGYIDRIVGIKLNSIEANNV